MVWVKGPGKLARLAGVVGIIAAATGGMLSLTQAHEPHVTHLIGETPVLSGHVDQAAIDSSALTFQQIFAGGAILFNAQFNILDGAGRPGATGNGTPTLRAVGSAPAFIRTSAPDANSCAGCHNQPRSGAAGDFVANVFVLAQVLDPVTDSVAPESSDERNTLGMMGAGAIEMLAREMSFELQAIRDAALAEAQATGQAVTRLLNTKGVNFGSITARPDGTLDPSQVEGVDTDLVIKPFHQKGVVNSIRVFTVNAMNHHHGMEAVERFGRARTGSDDFDQDGVVDELSVGDITAVTIWQAAQNNPGRVLPTDPERRQAAAQGEVLFSTVGCTECHRPGLVLNNPVYSEPNPFNPPGNLRPEDVPRPFSFDLTRDGPAPHLERLPAGTAIVRAFTDLKRHGICDADLPHFCNERVVQGGVPTDQFITRKLWDVGNTAPYGHRGDLSTITEAIVNHGGEGRASRDAFLALSEDQQAAIIEFLKTLQVVPEGAALVSEAP